MSNEQHLQLLAALPDDLEIYPHEFDLERDAVLLTRLPIADQANASFLDARVLRPSTQGAWFGWEHFNRTASTLPAGAPGYLLHVGHCGSTLLSRLMEEAAGLRALREPLPLRVLARDAAEEPDGASFLRSEERKYRLGLFERIWARGGGSVVKPTSMCNGLLEHLAGSAPAAFVFIRPQRFLEALLGGENASTDLRGFARMRTRRLRAISGLDIRLSDMTRGELAALTWLVETASVVQSKRPMHALCFDDFLADPVTRLCALSAHFGAPLDGDTAARAINGPIMRSYSKAPEHAYDAAMRAQILEQSRRENADEIRRGMNWLERVAGAFVAGGRALATFG